MIPRLLFLLVFIPLLAGCQFLEAHKKVSPAVYKLYLDQKAQDEAKEEQKNDKEELSEKIETRDQANQLLQALGNEPNQDQRLAKIEVNAQVEESNKEIKRLERVIKDRKAFLDEINEIEASKAIYLVPNEAYFSVGSVVAFDNDLNATAIPTVALNAYPFEGSCDTLGMQMVFGGALDSSGGGSTNIGLAIGGGFFLPIGASGSISFGHVLWDMSGNGENGWYIGINIGGSAKSKLEKPNTGA